jgi:hypothetical protein
VSFDNLPHQLAAKEQKQTCCMQPVVLQASKLLLVTTHAQLSCHVVLLWTCVVLSSTFHMHKHIGMPLAFYVCSGFLLLYNTVLRFHCLLVLQLLMRTTTVPWSVQNSLSSSSTWPLQT